MVAYIQLVFGLETTFRGLRTRPFAPRGKWAVPVCLGAVGLLLLATFLVAFFIKTPDFCFASLFWFVARYSIGCFGAFLGITVFLAKYAILIYIRLRRSTRIEASERVAASRLIYYMAFGVLSNVSTRAALLIASRSNANSLAGPVDSLLLLRCIL